MVTFSLDQPVEHEIAAPSTLTSGAARRPRRTDSSAGLLGAPRGDLGRARRHTRQRCEHEGAGSQPEAIHSATP